MMEPPLGSGYVRRLSGKEKAAILVVTLGPDLAASVFRYLGEREIETLTQAISAMPVVTPDVRDDVVREFHSKATSEARSDLAGPDYALALLQRSLGSDKAYAIMERLAERDREPVLGIVRKTEPGQLTEFIRNEHPQTIAVILAHLRPNQAGTVLAALPADRQVEVARRLATLDRTAPEMLHEIEGVLQRQLTPMSMAEMQTAGGVRAVVDIINRVDRVTEKTILDGLQNADPDLAEEVRKQMLMFEDVVRLDQRSMQRVIREVEAKDWALAFRVASEDVMNHVFQNMSQRLVELVREEMSYLGLVRLREVEDAQQRIADTIRALEEAGEVIVARGEEDEIFV